MSQFKMMVRGEIVRFWNVFSQAWERRNAKALTEASDLMASFSSQDRLRVRKVAKREHKIVVFTPADGVVFSKAFDSEGDASKAYEAREISGCERIQLVIDGAVSTSRGYVGRGSQDPHPNMSI
jgi:hypothetical protein